MLVIFSGSAGVGKNTVINELLSEFSNLIYAPSVTTRAPREGETQGNPYIFVTDPQFREMLKNGEMFEHAEVHGHFYGTNKKLITEYMEKGRVVVKDVDVEGTLNLKKIIPDLVSIYLAPVSREQLRERLVGRGEKDIELRLKRFEYENGLSENYDYKIINDKLSETLETLREILEKEAKKRGETLNK